MTACGTVACVLQNPGPSEDGRQRRAQFMRNHREELVFRGHFLFELAGSKILAQDGVSEYLQELAVQHQPTSRHRLLLPCQLPQVPERDTSLARQPLDRGGLCEVHERIGRHRGPDNTSLQEQRRADDGQPVR